MYMIIPPFRTANLLSERSGDRSVRRQQPGSLSNDRLYIQHIQPGALLMFAGRRSMLHRVLVATSGAKIGPRPRRSAPPASFVNRRPVRATKADRVSYFWEEIDGYEECYKSTISTDTICRMTSCRMTSVIQKPNPNKERLSCGSVKFFALS